MTKKEAIKLFEERKVRTVWDDELEKWYFSIVDVIGVLTDSPDPRNYWKVLKNRLKKEGNETVTNCNQLKLVAEDGKKRLTDVADTEQLFRLIQSVPSPKRLYSHIARSIVNSGSCNSSILSLAICAIHPLKGSALGEGTD